MSVLDFVVSAQPILGVIRFSLRALGVGVVSVTGGTALVAAIQNLAENQLGLLPGEVQSILGMLQVDYCVNVLIFFMNMRLAISGGRRLGLI